MKLYHVIQHFAHNGEERVFPVFGRNAARRKASDLRRYRFSTVRIEQVELKVRMPVFSVSVEDHDETDVLR